MNVSTTNYVDFHCLQRQKKSPLQAALYKLHLAPQRTLAVKFVRNPKARRYILRMLPGGAARVTIPRGGSLAYALRFAEKNKAWIEKQISRNDAVWTEGTMVLLRGEATAIALRNNRAVLGPFECDLLPDLRLNMETLLRNAAEAELTARTRELAALHGLSVREVRVRAQRSRWGSCSNRGTISLNWRLIQTPDLVRDYIIVHELMHLHEMNHSPRFWEHVAKAFPAYREAERWLRKHAGLLR